MGFEDGSWNGISCWPTFRVADRFQKDLAFREGCAEKTTLSSFFVCG
jgi:hypothetical protein